MCRLMVEISVRDVRPTRLRIHNRRSVDISVKTSTFRIAGLTSKVLCSTLADCDVCNDERSFGRDMRH